MMRPMRIRKGRLEIDRRTVLRGLGSAVALPFLDAMTPMARAAGVLAGLGETGRRRLLYVFFPNGVHYQDWKPSGEGTDFELSPLLAPLE